MSCKLKINLIGFLECKHNKIVVNRRTKSSESNYLHKTGEDNTYMYDLDEVLMLPWRQKEAHIRDRKRSKVSMYVRVSG